MYCLWCYIGCDSFVHNELVPVSMVIVDLWVLNVCSYLPMSVPIFCYLLLFKGY